MIDALFFVVEYQSAFDARDHFQSVRTDEVVIAVSLYVDIVTSLADKGLAALLTRGNILALMRYFHMSPTKSSLFKLGTAYFANAMLFFVMSGAFFLRDEDLVA